MSEVRRVEDRDLPGLAIWTRRSSIAATPPPLREAVRVACDDGALPELYSEEALARTCGFELVEAGQAVGAAVVCTSPHPCDGSPEALLHTLAVEPRESTAPLLGAAAAWARERGCVCLRVRSASPPPDDIPGLSWTPASVRVSKRLDPEAAAAALRTSPVRIRTATADDLPTLREGVARSVREGLMPFERRRIAQERIEAWARTFLGDLVARPSAALMAEHERRVVGYALADLDHVEVAGGEREAWLHDVLITDEAAPHGAGRALTATVELLAARAGRATVSGTVDRPGLARSEALLARLEADGWHRREATTLAELRPAPTLSD